MKRAMMLGLAVAVLALPTTASADYYVALGA
jgi:hypothetical protein